jgi:hypothetical protein
LPSPLCLRKFRAGAEGGSATCFQLLLRPE